MAGFEYLESPTVQGMARELAEHARYQNVLRNIDVDRIIFLHASGKKKPKSIPTPIQIKAQTPLNRAIAPHVVFVVIVYDEFFDEGVWNEAKQYCAILQQLLLIETEKDDINFNDGKLRKYDVLDLRFMITNFGVEWFDAEKCKHPIDGSWQLSSGESMVDDQLEIQPDEADEEPQGTPGSPTFSGNQGYATSEGSVTGTVTPDDLASLGDELDSIPVDGDSAEEAMN